MQLACNACERSTCGKHKLLAAKGHGGALYRGSPKDAVMHDFLLTPQQGCNQPSSYAALVVSAYHHEARGVQLLCLSTLHHHDALVLATSWKHMPLYSVPCLLYVQAVSVPA